MAGSEDPKVFPEHKEWVKDGTLEKEGHGVDLETIPGGLSFLQTLYAAVI